MKPKNEMDRQAKVQKFRERSRKANADERHASIDAIQSAFRAIARIAKLPCESLPKDIKGLLHSLALPDDYEKIIDHLKFCSPKTRRIADRCILACKDMELGEYTLLLKRAFFNESGKLKNERIDLLFSRFYLLLLEKKRFIRKEKSKWIPWEEAEKKIMGN